MRRPRARAPLALLLVSRDLGVVAHYCQRVAVMYAGQIVEVADVPDLLRRRQAIPTAGGCWPRWLPPATAAARDVGGKPRRPRRRSCPYAPRCPLCVERCTREAPPLEPVANARWVRCFRHAEITAGLVAP